MQGSSTVARTIFCDDASSASCSSSVLAQLGTTVSALTVIIESNSLGISSRDATNVQQGQRTAPEEFTVTVARH